MADAPSARTRSRRRSSSWLLLLLAVSTSSALAGTSCLSRRQDDTPATNECTVCHGDARRGGDPLRKSAPPRDLLGAELPSYPGVGAHQIHLNAGATHGALACNECHVVPRRVDSPGHADSAGPAELVFGALASAHDHAPSYDPIARTCDDSYCHGPARAVWTEPRSSDQACGTCHGLPPPAPHPQSEQCSTCHGQVIDEHRRFVAPELHVNGLVELRAESCTQCHGQGVDPAPPLDTLGNDSPRKLGVGAHAVHLSGGNAGRPLACDECHEVPEKPTDFSHADGLPAELTLRGVGTSNGRAPIWDHASATCVDSWCHGPGEPHGSSPRWNEPASLPCGGCHGVPPPAPHPQMKECSRCHGSVVAQDNITIIDRDAHVNGVVDSQVPESCTTCHGTKNPAPPRDTQGGEDTSLIGVGAHQTHVLGTERSRPVPCDECHQVPTQVLDAGHIDSALPAELRFNGAALAFGAQPSFDGEKCVNTSCHGAKLTGAHASGGSLTEPTWTKVDGSQNACGSCHGLPPPRPHPYYSRDCGRCHHDMNADGTAFVRPDLHVDGVVTFDLPP